MRTRDIPITLNEDWNLKARQLRFHLQFLHPKAILSRL